MADQNLLARITYDPKIFGGKPIVRGHRLAVEHVLSCLQYAQRIVGHERVEPLLASK